LSSGIQQVAPNEVSVERLRFVCTGCANERSVDHGVHHLTDGNGHVRAAAALLPSTGQEQSA
jgi:hypothetical protein